MPLPALRLTIRQSGAVSATVIAASKPPGPEFFDFRLDRRRGSSKKPLSQVLYNPNLNARQGGVRIEEADEALSEIAPLIVMLHS